MQILERLFSGAKVDAFAKLLAGEIAERCGTGAVGATADKRAHRRLIRVLEGVYGKARAYRKDNRLGVYGKARLGNTFKWELRELGFEDDFVEETTKGLVLAMTQE